MSRPLVAILATIGLVALAPIIARAQGYGGGGGYGNPSVDSGFEEAFQYQMMLEVQQQQRRLQQSKKGVRAKPKGQISPSASKVATAAADAKTKKPPDNLTGAKAKLKTRSTKAATTKTAKTPGPNAPVKAKSQAKTAPTKTATEPRTPVASPSSLPASS